MKPAITVLGFVVLLMGLLPFVMNIGFTPSFLSRVPTSGPVYSGIVAALGIIIVLLGAGASTNIFMKR